VSELIEGQAEELSTEVVTAPAVQPSTLFRTDDPAEVLKRATATADALAPVLKAQNMAVRIGPKEHVVVEGWQTLGSMLGVTPVGVWTRKLENGWEAKVNAQTLDGRIIGSAESMCDRKEERWEKADEYAIRSMAQTRATSKALASVLRFVVTLAGFSGTPAEEMPAGGATRNAASHTTPASPKQIDFAKKLLGDAELSDEGRRAIWVWGSHEGKLSKPRASRIIEALKEGQANALLSEAGFSDLPAPDTEGLDAPHDSDDEIKF